MTFACFKSSGYHHEAYQIQALLAGYTLRALLCAVAFALGAGEDASGASLKSGSDISNLNAAACADADWPVEGKAHLNAVDLVAKLPVRFLAGPTAVPLHLAARAPHQLHVLFRDIAGGAVAQEDACVLHWLQSRLCGGSI